MVLCLVIIVGISIFIVPVAVAIEMPRSENGHQVLYGYHDHGDDRDHRSHHRTSAIIISLAPDYNGNLALVGEAMTVRELQDQLEARDRRAQVAAGRSRTYQPSGR